MIWVITVDDCVLHVVAFRSETGGN